MARELTGTRISLTPRDSPAPTNLAPAAKPQTRTDYLMRPVTLVPHRLTAAERHRLISDLAYRRAQQRGFVPGGDVDDWLDAEREVDAGRY